MAKPISFFGPRAAEWRAHLAHGSDGNVLVVGRVAGALEVLPPSSSVWCVGLYGAVRAHGRDGERTWWLYVPRAWGNWRKLPFGERKCRWINHERARQQAWLSKIEKRAGRAPRGGWKNARRRCRERIDVLDSIERGRKDAKLLHLDEFLRWAKTRFDGDLRIRHEIEEILQDLRHTRGVDLPVNAEGGVLISIGDRAPAWAAKLAQAALGYSKALDLRADGEHEGATERIREASRLAAEGRAGLWAGARSGRAARKEPAHERYRLLVRLHAAQKRRNDAIPRRSSRLSYDELNEAVACIHMNDTGDLVSARTVERALAWAKDTGYVPPASS